MALPTERTWAALDALSTTNLNAGIRDVLTFLMAPPVCQVRQTSVQAIANTTFVPLTFTAEDIDSHNGHDNATNPSRYTAQEDGWYQLSGGVSIEANATGQRAALWYKNGAALNGSDVLIDATAALQTRIPARVILVSLVAGDYVELVAWQNSTAPRNTNVTNGYDQSSMTVQWVRRI